jgi:drug/metabolite transporter (DMT)-like permease
LIFHEKPTRFMLAGAVLIIAAGLYIALRDSARGGRPEQIEK